MAKPKAKSAEEKQAALDQMLSMAATTNHMTGAGAKAAPAEPAKGVGSAPTAETAPDQKEQKGENVAVTPAAEPLVAAVAPEPMPAPAEAVTPASERAVALPAPAASSPEPAPAEPAEPELALETVPEAPSSKAIPASASTVEVGTVELASLFVPSGDKKVFTMRLTDDHYQYLLLLGTIVGNGASPPDIVHNIIAHFIDRNDAQIQKAITKQLRQRQLRK